MRHEARITVYDMLDQVVITVQVYGVDDDGPMTRTRELHWARQYPSRGESDATRWVTQLLEQAVRDLHAGEKRRLVDDAPPLGPHTVSGVAEDAKAEKP